MTEDDSAICLIVSVILRRMGHTVEVVRNGKEAINLATVKPDHFDIMVTDHDIPQGSSLEVVHHLRENGFSGKIIVMSGSLTDDLIYAHRDRHVDKILQKPFTLQNLSTTLGNLFSQWSEGLSGSAAGME